MQPTPKNHVVFVINKVLLKTFFSLGFNKNSDKNVNSVFFFFDNIMYPMFFNSLPENLYY